MGWGYLYGESDEDGGSGWWWLGWIGDGEKIEQNEKWTKDFSSNPDGFLFYFILFICLFIFCFSTFIGIDRPKSGSLIDRFHA